MNSDSPPGFSTRDPLREARLWAMALHLSQLSGYLVPFAGLVVPIVIWQVKKNEFPELDSHGKMVVNWMITELILAAVCVILTFAFIGFFLLILLGIVGVIFPIIGGIKANDGVLWNYPMTIKFFH